MGRTALSASGFSCLSMDARAAEALLTPGFLICIMALDRKCEYDSQLRQRHFVLSHMLMRLPTSFFNINTLLCSALLCSTLLYSTHHFPHPINGQLPRREASASVSPTIQKSPHSSISTPRPLRQRSRGALGV